MLGRIKRLSSKGTTLYAQFVVVVVALLGNPNASKWRTLSNAAPLETRRSNPACSRQQKVYTKDTTIYLIPAKPTTYSVGWAIFIFYPPYARCTHACLNLSISNYSSPLPSCSRKAHGPFRWFEHDPYTQIHTQRERERERERERVPLLYIDHLHTISQANPSQAKNTYQLASKLSKSSSGSNIKSVSKILKEA